MCHLHTTFFFWQDVQDLSSPRPGIEPAPPAWKHGVLITGLQEALFTIHKYS